MKLKLYQVDAFAAQVFGGNPAAVCPLEAWLDDALMQRIAAENNLSETAFFVPTARGFFLRWFTPSKEVDLCGHATLAAAHVLFKHLNYSSPTILFETKSGDLHVQQSTHGISMDFPAIATKIIAPPAALLDGLGVQPQAILAGMDYLVVLGSEAEVKALTPDLSAWKTLDLRGVIVTAQGDGVDMVSRAFFPKFGIDEDPVTGSAHCALTPYWAKKLGKNILTAYQLSKRGGHVYCTLRDDRVEIAGQAQDYMCGEISLSVGQKNGSLEI